MIDMKKKIPYVRIHYNFLNFQIEYVIPLSVDVKRASLSLWKFNK